MHFVYVLRSQAFNRFYVGMTEDIERRIGEHNNGKAKSTKFYAPWNLVFVEKFETRAEARRREKFLKGGSGKELIKQYFYGSRNHGPVA
jgi:putative endonuclease